MKSFNLRGGVTTAVVIPAALAGFGLMLVLHLLIGQFRVELVLPTGLIAASLAGFFAWRTHQDNATETDRRGGGIDAIVIAGIVLWTIFNLLFTSQHLFTNRDPATYNLAGFWLVNHQSINIEKPASTKTLDINGLTADSLGFATNPNNTNQIQAQGTHILPALQALAGKFLGSNGILRLNVLFGATALLAFYGFSRLIIRPNWAALGVLVMGLSLPLLFVSRDTYTEPLTMTFTFAGLALLLLAQRSRVKWQWFLAGLVIGATALTRIDAYLTFIGIITAIIIGLMLAKKGKRLLLAQCSGWLMLGLFVMGYVAWLDVSVLSNPYYMAHKQYIFPQLGLIAGLLVFGSIATMLNWKYKLTAKLDRLTSGWRDKAIWVGVCGFFVVLASRPIWYIGYQNNEAGVPVRTFSEQTLNWIIWYIGPVLMALGVAGLSLVIIRLLKKKDSYLLPFITVISVTSLLYLLRPSITADQVWATRRLLPIVIPGFVLLGMWMAQWLYQKKSYRWRGRKYNLEIIVTVLVTTSVLSPLFVTYPFLIRKLYVPQLSQVQAICEQAPKNTTFVWAGEASKFTVQPTRSICGNDSLGLNLVGEKAELNRPQLAELASKARASNTPLIIGWFKTDKSKLPLNQPAEKMEISNITFNEIEHTYKRAPRNLINLHQTIYMGEINGDGTINPTTR